MTKDWTVTPILMNTECPFRRSSLTGYTCNLLPDNQNECKENQCVWKTRHTHFNLVDLGIACETCGATDGWLCGWCEAEK